LLHLIKIKVNQIYTKLKNTLSGKGKLNIILVEPFEYLRRRAFSILQELEYNKIFEPGNPEKIEDFFENISFDLVLININLKDYSAIDLIPSIRKSHSSIGIIVMSSILSLKSNFDIIKSGANDIIKIPLDKKELNRSIHYVMDFPKRKV
jgi:DNA-binding NtrC family response regulator